MAATEMQLSAEDLEKARQQADENSPDALDVGAAALCNALGVVIPWLKELADNTVDSLADALPFPFSLFGDELAESILHALIGVMEEWQRSGCGMEPLKDPNVAGDATKPPSASITGKVPTS